jgi:aminopeptidase
MDPRVQQMARVLVEHSAQIGPGDRVLIEAEPVAEPLIRAMYERILKQGGHPYLLLSLDGLETYTGLDDVFLRYAGDVQLEHEPAFHILAYDQFESRIRIKSLSNTKSLAKVDPARIARRTKATGRVLEAQLKRGGEGEFRWVTTLFPTAAYAQEAEMSLEEYEAFVYEGCHVADPDSDPIAYWEDLGREQERLVSLFRGHDLVHIQSPHCDLSLSIKGRVFINSFGLRNMPDGEIFTGPVEDSVEGWIHFTYPAVYQGTESDGVRLRFEQGRIVEASAEKNEAFLLNMLEVDSNARYVGELGIGTNTGIQKHTKNILFDEKMGGTIHLALGAGYPQTGSRNKSAIHWDMICDIREDSAISIDGVRVYENGEFLS